MRPALPPRQKRTRRKELTFSPTEWAAIEQRAHECGVRPNCYIRDVVLGAVPRARPNDATRDLVAAVNRIGNNLNQLARVANENGDLPREAEFDTLRAELMDLLARVLGVDGDGGSAVRSPRRSRARARPPDEAPMRRPVTRE